MEAEGFILVLIICLIILFIGYLAYSMYVNFIVKEGYQDNEFWNRFIGITNICLEEDNSPECVDISFSDYDNSVRSIKAILDPGYGVDPDTGFVIYVGEPTRPNYTNPSTTRDMFARDYTVNEDDMQPIPPLPFDFPISDYEGPLPTDSRFDKDNIDIEYHADPAKLPNAKDNLTGYALIKNSNGQVVPIPYSELSGQTLYDSSNKASYVPNYEETTFLSKLTNEIPFLPITEIESGSTGFCANKGNTLTDVEEKCNSLNNETCASTDCCVLLGGAKCVAGSQTGPSIQSNYTDYILKNTDYYYYRGKCYGNCSRSYGIKNTAGYNDGSITAATYSPSNDADSPPVPIIARVPWSPPFWNTDIPWNYNGNWDDWYNGMINGGISNGSTPTPTEPTA